MKRVLVSAAATLLLVTPAVAAPKPCEELKSEIEAKIKKKRTQPFTLDLVVKREGPKAGAAVQGDAKKDAAGEGKVVGTCEGGTKQIIYKK